MLNKIKKVINQPDLVIGRMNMHGWFNWMNDKSYLKFMFKVKLGYKLDLENPQTFNEKMQWLKLNNIHPEYSKLVDKYEVREYIKNKLGEEYLIPLIGVWESPEEIDFSKLPMQFVLKCTHNSGGVIVCKDKTKFDEKAAIKKLKRLLKKEYYMLGREYPYKNVKPRIVCEKYMDDGSGGLPADYKIICFNGTPQNIMVCNNRRSGHADYYFFDRDWKFLPYNKVDINRSKDFTLPKPKCIDEMWNIAEKLAEPYIISRIDLYEINGKVYFGEITFFPSSGMDTDITKEIDILWGKSVNITAR